MGDVDLIREIKLIWRKMLPGTPAGSLKLMWRNKKFIRTGGDHKGRLRSCQVRLCYVLFFN
jgi:hypothetical protein